MLNGLLLEGNYFSFELETVDYLNKALAGKRPRIKDPFDGLMAGWTIRVSVLAEDMVVGHGDSAEHCSYDA